MEFMNDSKLAKKGDRVIYVEVAPPGGVKGPDSLKIITIR